MRARRCVGLAATAANRSSQPRSYGGGKKGRQRKRAGDAPPSMPPAAVCMLCHGARHTLRADSTLARLGPPLAPPLTIETAAAIRTVDDDAAAAPTVVADLRRPLSAEQLAALGGPFRVVTLEFAPASVYSDAPPPRVVGRRVDARGVEHVRVVSPDGDAGLPHPRRAFFANVAALLAPGGAFAMDAPRLGPSWRRFAREAVREHPQLAFARRRNLLVFRRQPPPS